MKLIECDHCHGEGQVLDPNKEIHQGKYVHYGKSTCGFCGGTGQISIYEKETKVSSSDKDYQNYNKNKQQHLNKNSKNKKTSLGSFLIIVIIGAIIVYFFKDSKEDVSVPKETTSTFENKTPIEETSRTDNNKNNNTELAYLNKNSEKSWDNLYSISESYGDINDPDRLPKEAKIVRVTTKHFIYFSECLQKEPVSSDKVNTKQQLVIFYENRLNSLTSCLNNTDYYFQNLELDFEYNDFLYEGYVHALESLQLDLRIFINDIKESLPSNASIYSIRQKIKQYDRTVGLEYKQVINNMVETANSY